MNNDEKVREIIECQWCNRPKHDSVANAGYSCDICRERRIVAQMAQWKDEQAISEQGGWHTEIPDVDCFVLLRTVEFPKNCKAIVAEWDNEHKCFYSEADDSPVEEWSEWKLIEMEELL